MTTTPISSATNTEVVTYTIKIEGETLPSRLSLFGLDICKEVCRIPCAKLVITDGNLGQQDFPISNEDWFIPGKAIEIYLGYRAEEALVFKGVVIKHRISIRPGFSSLEVDCRDVAYRMTLRPNSQFFEDIKDSDAATQLIDNYQLSHEITATEHQHKELVQFDVSDWDFLLMRMEFNGLITLLDDGVFAITAPDFEQEPALRIEYGATVLEFDAELEVRDQFFEVKTQSWDYSNQQILELTATEPDIQANGNLPAADIAAVNNDEPIIHRHGGYIIEGELQAWADARVLKDRLSRTQGRVKIPGFAEVKMGQLIELNGFGERFNGVVYVVAVRHEYYQGVWLTDIQFGLSPKWFTQTIKPERPAAAGMLAAVNGLQVGVVSQIENDPDGEFRIRLRLPIVDNQADGIWARIATLDAGNARGSFFLPEVGDEVIIGFINDDPRDAVVLGMLHSSDKPAPFTSSEENNEKGFVTREGLKLVFQEQDKSITLETPAGNKLVISDDESGIAFTDQHGNSIQLDANGISLNSEQNIEIKAKSNINSEAGSQWKAQASSQAQLKSNGTLTIQGSMVNIN